MISTSSIVTGSIVTTWRAASYIRLSKEDEKKRHGGGAQSESVQNQKSLIRQYIDDQGYVFVDEYVDDGVTGTTLAGV